MGSVLSRRGDPTSPPATETNTPMTTETNTPMTTETNTPMTTETNTDPDEGCLDVRGNEDYNEIVTDDPDEGCLDVRGNEDYNEIVTDESDEDPYELSPRRRTRIKESQESSAVRRSRSSSSSAPIYPSGDSDYILSCPTARSPGPEFYLCLQHPQHSFISHKSSLPKRRDPRSLRWMCEDVLLKNQISHRGYTSDTSTWSVSMQKDFKRYVGVRVHLNGAVLQAPGSEVILSIPSGLKAFVMGHIHTDPKPFLHAIPEDECLVAPIVDYTYEFRQWPPRAWFKISVPHCITNKKHLKEVRVRHGNIHWRRPFTRVPSNDCLFDVDEHHIIIFTTRFSQFICTVCSRECQGSARAFIFGGLTPLTLPPVHSSLRVYMCSPLYRINDYRQKLVEIEGGLLIKRHRLDESDVTWNPDETQEELCVAVQSNWDPRQPTKTNQEWDQDTRKLVQKMKASGMLDMQRCHICKTDPSEVATFSFTAPPTTNGPQVALMFSGRLEMSIRDHGVLMQSDFDVIPNEICTATQNDDHLRLRRVTKLVICRPEELVDFGLGLGLTHGQVKQKETNNSTSIENAALDVVVEWWDACPERYERKVEFLVNVVDNIGKSKLAARVREMMRKVHNGPEVNNNNNIPCAEEGASQISLPVPEMLPVQSTNQVTQ